MAQLSVRLVAPDRTVFEGEAAAVTAPAWDGQVGILPGHAPFLTLIGQGHLIIDRPGGGHDGWWVAGGALKVDRNIVTVLTEFVHHEEPDELPAGIRVPRPDDYFEGAPAINPLA